MQLSSAEITALAEAFEQRAPRDILQWAADNFNERKLLFASPLELDLSSLADYIEEQKDQQERDALTAEKEPGEPRPFADAYMDSVVRLRDMINRRNGERRDQIVRRASGRAKRLARQ